MLLKRIFSFVLVFVMLVGMLPVAQATDGNTESQAEQMESTTETEATEDVPREPSNEPTKGTELSEESTAPDEEAAPEGNFSRGKSETVQILDGGTAKALYADGEIVQGDYVPFQFNLKQQIEVKYRDEQGTLHTYHNQNLGCHFAGDGDPSTERRDFTSPDQLIYCLEPFKAFSASGSYYDEFIGEGDTGESSGEEIWNFFTWEQQIAIGLVLLYGSPSELWDTNAGLGNPNSGMCGEISNPNCGYRAATQIILWEFIADLRDASTFEYKNNGYTSPTIYYDNALGVSVGADGTDYFKKGYDYIINCLKKHFKVPSFTHNFYSQAPTIQLTGKVTQVTDTNGVLSRCNFADTKDVKFDKNGNVLTITVVGDTVPDTVFSTVKDIPSAEKTKYRLFWNTYGAQSLIQVAAPAKADPITAYFKLKAAAGKVEFVKKTNTGGTLVGWEISLYRDAACTDLVGTYTTASGGKITTGDLEPGTYYAKETGYPDTMSDNSKRFWVMDSDVETVVVEMGKTATVTFENNFCRQ